MQTASRDSLAEARKRLDALTEGAEPEALRTLADDLLAVGGLLEREHALRRALSDPSTEEAARLRLVDAVLRGRIGAPALEELHGLVASRWSSPGDLIDACQLLGVQALLASAETEGVLADVEDELFRFLRITEGNPQLAAILGDPADSASRRDRLVEALLAGKAKPATVRLVEVAVAGLGGRAFEGSMERLTELAAERRDRQLAYVTVPVPITAEQERRLAAALSRTYRREISVQVEVDPSILGGAIVRVGDDLYDGSIARRLDQVRGALAH